MCIRDRYNGVLINGVEVLSYKSQDLCYYGDIKSIDVTGGGRKYDVINPPQLAINDATGVGATGYNDVVIIKPCTVIIWVCIANASISTKDSVFKTGGVGKSILHSPGFTIMCVFVAMFCIVPGAGITGNGNNAPWAPIQYPLNAGPQSPIVNCPSYL